LKRNFNPGHLKHEEGPIVIVVMNAFEIDSSGFAVLVFSKSLRSSSSSDFFGLDIIACSDVHWSAHLLVGLPGSLRPRGL
jgi:hypothetical protein